MPASRYILVVDDEPQIHRFLRPTFVAAGFAVESALSGAQPPQKVRAAPPELVVLDLWLIDIDGSAVLAAPPRAGLSGNRATARTAG